MFEIYKRTTVTALVRLSNMGKRGHYIWQTSVTRNHNIYPITACKGYHLNWFPFPFGVSLGHYMDGGPSRITEVRLCLLGGAFLVINAGPAWKHLLLYAHAQPLNSSSTWLCWDTSRRSSRERGWWEGDGHFKMDADYGIWISVSRLAKLSQTSQTTVYHCQVSLLHHSSPLPSCTVTGPSLLCLQTERVALLLPPISSAHTKRRSIPNHYPNEFAARALIYDMGGCHCLEQILYPCSVYSVDRAKLHCQQLLSLTSFLLANDATFLWLSSISRSVPREACVASPLKDSVLWYNDHAATGFTVSARFCMLVISLKPFSLVFLGLIILQDYKRTPRSIIMTRQTWKKETCSHIILFLKAFFPNRWWKVLGMVMIG